MSLPSNTSAAPPSAARSRELLEAYRSRVGAIVAGLDLDAVGRVVDRLFELWLGRGLLAIAGNGGSATTASHMAADLVLATRLVGPPLFRTISLAENGALLTALANDRGYDAVFSDQLEGLLGPGDGLLLISASGNSPNVVAAAQRANHVGASTIALVGFDGGRLASICDEVVHVPSRSGEYGPVEDAHLMLEHMITEAVRDRIARAAEGR